MSTLASPGPDEHVSRPVGAWLHAMLPEIDPEPWPDACWVAFAMTRSPEHHPPLYWLGRALDELARLGMAEATSARVRGAHGLETCRGWSEEDQRTQDVLSEACAVAWAHERLGAPELRTAAVERAGDERPLLYVPRVDAYVAPRRLWPVRTLDQLLRQAASVVEEAAAALPADARGRYVYLDLPLNMFGWAQDVGYAAPVTEPVRTAVKHFAGEHRVGYVLTRPFQWAAPLEAWY